MGEDLFFTSATTEFLREIKDRSEKAIAGYDVELSKAIGARRAHLVDRIGGARRQIAAVDAELKRRGNDAR